VTSSLLTPAATSLRRLSDEPILTPRAKFTWERGACLNSAVAYENDTWYLLYRAIDHDPSWAQDNNAGMRYQSSVGLATSRDGIRFDRQDEPIIPVGFFGGNTEAQDCRITKIDGTYYLVYCLYDCAEGIPTVGYSTSSDMKKWTHHGKLVSFEQFGFNKNGTLFPRKINGRFALLHRPECLDYLSLPGGEFNWRTWSRGPLTPEVQAPGVTISFSEDLQHWTDTKVLLEPRAGEWDSVKVGPGAPPIETPQGWLNVYHGVDENHVYRLGLALHDLDDPTIVLKRQIECFHEPQLDWELKGDVDGAIFTCGAALKDTTLRVYYAGADTVLGVGEADVASFLEG